METIQLHKEARPAFRCIAGVIGVLVLILALPISVVVAVSSDSSMWSVAFGTLVAGVGFVTLAITGRFLCFRRDTQERVS